MKVAYVCICTRFVLQCPCGLLTANILMMFSSTDNYRSFEKKKKKKHECHYLNLTNYKFYFQTERNSKCFKPPLPHPLSLYLSWEGGAGASSLQYVSLSSVTCMHDCTVLLHAGSFRLSTITVLALFKIWTFYFYV